MSTMLDKARREFEAGKYKAAIESLYSASPIALAGDPQDKRAILDLATTIHGQVDRRLQQDCDEIADSMRNALDREFEDPVVAELRAQAIASLGTCRYLGGAGLPVEPGNGQLWSLVFTDVRVVLLLDHAPSAETTFDLGWEGLRVEIGGAGQIRRGGGFIGGGFGLAGAAAGMLTASALNSLTMKTGMDTVVHLATPSVEVFLHYDREAPAALRRTLAPVFLKLRQESAFRGPKDDATSEHVVDRLHKLAGLLDRGLITEEEFARLKADLMSQVP